MAATIPGEKTTGTELDALPTETDDTSAVNYLSALATTAAKATLAIGRGVHEGTFPHKVVAEVYGRSLLEAADDPDDPAKKIVVELLAQSLSTGVAERIRAEVRSQR